MQNETLLPIIYNNKPRFLQILYYSTIPTYIYNKINVYLLMYSNVLAVAVYSHL